MDRADAEYTEDVTGEAPPTGLDPVVPVRVIDTVPVEPRRPRFFTTGQTPVGTDPVRIAAASSQRDSITLVNAGPTTVYIGSQAVTIYTGFALLPGATLTLSAQSDVLALSAGAGGMVHVLQEFTN